MLKSIFIQNYALIDLLEIEFDSGLNIITGETGAGKSILLGALSLLLGNRADVSTLLDKSKKCIVEGVFNVDLKSVESFFSANDLDPEFPIVIRREISSEGKSRAFINDTPSTLGQLRDLSMLLVDIHSQHETLLLNSRGFQLEVVDAFCRHDALLDEYKSGFRKLNNLTATLNELMEEEKKVKADRDYYGYLFEELHAAALIPGEQEKLEEEIQSLLHAEEIRQALGETSEAILLNEDNILGRISRLVTGLQAVSRYSPVVEGLAERLKSTDIELKDIAVELEAAAGSISANPGRIEIVQDRLNIINNLELKHRVKSQQELITLMKSFELKLESIDSLDERIIQLQKEINALKETLSNTASKISANRNKAIPKIESEIKKLLAQVSLPGAVLKIENTIPEQPEMKSTGIDQIKFLFSANKGIVYQDISKAASGGELSRLMLCIKSAVARLMSLPSIIFDEIDTGISGETALNVGNVLNGMSQKHQLIAITHLPQIAGRGEAHY